MALLDRGNDDTVALSEQLLMETFFGQEILTVVDQTIASLIASRSASDTVETTDVAATGYIRWANPSDTVALTDQMVNNISYQRTLSEEIALPDLIHTWQYVNGALQVDFEGDGDLRAVLVKKNTTAAVAMAPPPRVVVLPKPPKELQEHVVVNPNPPSREER